MHGVVPPFVLTLAFHGVVRQRDNFSLITVECTAESCIALLFESFDSKLTKCGIAILNVNQMHNEELLNL